MPDLTGAGSACEERRKQHIVQQHARLVLLVVFDRPGMVRLNSTGFRQQDGLAGLEGDCLLYRIGCQQIHRTVTHRPPCSQVQITVHLGNVVSREPTNVTIPVTLGFAVVASQALHSQVLRESCV
jgi:hypothetical protein